MNLALVLSWGSSFVSLPLPSTTHLRLNSPAGCHELLSPREHRGSNELAAAFRARGETERPNENGKNSNENRGRYRDSGNPRRYGGRTSNGYGGRRRDRKKQLHPGAYTMIDEKTGETVIVWGVEDDDDIPVPTAADLEWNYTKMPLPGDVSEDTWAKAIENSLKLSGSFSVKGVEQQGRGFRDDLEDEDSADDDDDEIDFYSDLEEEPTETKKVTVSRPPRVKLFGRDLWGKSTLKAKNPEQGTTVDVASELTFDGEGVASVEVARATGIGLVNQISDSIKRERVVLKYAEAATAVQEDRPHTEVGASLQDSGLVISPPVIVAQVESTASVDLSKNKRNANFPEGISTYEDCAAQSSRATKADDVFIEGSSFSPKSNCKSSEGTTIAAKSIGGFEKEQNYSPKVTSKSDYISAKPRSTAAKSVDRLTEERSNTSKVNDNPVQGRSKASQSSFNPYIIDISDDHRPKEQQEVRNSGLLDKLRLQVTGRKQMAQDSVQRVVHVPSKEGHSSSTAAMNDDKQVSMVCVNDSVRPPIRDWTARDNYDASIANEFFSLKSFEDVGTTPEVIKALAYLQVQQPSQIQAMAFKPILEGRSCVIAEQTGSGKTLAYVAPLVQRMKADEAGSSVKSLSKKPCVLVLVPTGELAAQVLGTFRALSKGGVPCRSVVITGGFKWKTQVESLEGGADVVVATPGRLLQHLNAGNIQFDNLKSVVLDEVDILFDDEDFSNALETINKAASIKVQYIHVTATLPVHIHDDLVERYPDCLSLMGPNLHRTAAGLQEVLVDCSGGEIDEKTPESAFRNKKTALLQLVEERPVAKTIIFCNKVETCRKVENVLTRYDRSGKKITVLPYHAALSQETRLESLETFMKSQPKERLFLVCTDRASRGIDSLDVEHVVLFDFPRDPSEYVRRVGRTARGAGGTGKVFVFVVGRQVSQARRIMTRNNKGEPVHDVPGSRYYYAN